MSHQHHRPRTLLLLNGIVDDCVKSFKLSGNWNLRGPSCRGFRLRFLRLASRDLLSESCRKEQNQQEQKLKKSHTGSADCDACVRRAQSVGLLKCNPKG